jgi:hypothetical protein
VRQLDAQQPTLFHQKAGIKSRLNDIPRFCKEIMLAQQTGSADDLAALSGLTEALQSIDWKNQYVWAYAWEAIEDMDVNLASEGNSYYDPGIMKMFMTIYSYFYIFVFFKLLTVSNKWIKEKSPNHTPSGSSQGSRLSSAGADLSVGGERDMFASHFEVENPEIREAIEGLVEEK